jgi:hypothetical protein
LARFGTPARRTTVQLLSVACLTLPPSNRPALRHAGICVLCAIVGWIFANPLDSSEFSGGAVTAPLLAFHRFAGYFFLLSGAMIFVYRRVAAGIALVACFLAVPLYLYFTAPGPFRLLIPGEYTASLQASFTWDTAAVVGIVAVAVAAFASLTSLNTGRSAPPT